MNFITYIQQDIKLELDNGTLTLKAGSKVYVPNGSGVFETYTTVNDIIIHTGKTGSASGDYIILIKENETVSVAPVKQVFVGDNEPPTGTNPDTGGTYVWNYWYDTANNIIKSKSNNTWVIPENKIGLPVGVYIRTNGRATDIKEVFNGFGYMGSAVFALPGVEVNIPNGRDLQGGLSFSSLKINSLLINNNYNGGYAYLESSNNIISRIITSENEIPYNDIANAFVGANKVMFYYNYSLFDEVKEIDVIKASSSSISQYANSKKFMNLYNELSYMFSNAKTIEDWYNIVFNIKTATGYGLDWWGKILNQGRQVSYTENGTVVNVFLGGEQTIDGVTYSADYMENLYRTVLFLRAMSYITNCTVASLNNMLQFYFNTVEASQNALVYVIEYGVMEIRYVFRMYLSKVQKAIFAEVLPNPTGVGISFEYLPRSSNFGFFVNGYTAQNQPYAPLDNKPFYW